MNANDVVKQTLESCRAVTLRYLDDFSDADLLVRPVPAANHTAWQLGHLAVCERDLLEHLGYAAPELPAGFAEAHRPENARSDDAGQFCTKAEYLDVLSAVRQATLAVLDRLSEAELERPAPESMRAFAPTVAAALMLMGTHELLHDGQLVTVRRKLGKPVLF